MEGGGRIVELAAGDFKMKKVILVVLISVALIILTGIYVLSGIIYPQWWLEKYSARISALGNKSPNDLEIQEGLLFLYWFSDDIRYSEEEQWKKILAIDPNNCVAWTKEAQRACYDYSGKHENLLDLLSWLITDAKKRNVERIEFILGEWFADEGIEYIEKEQFDSAVEHMKAKLVIKAQEPLRIISKGESNDPENAIYNYYRAHIYLLLGRREDALKEIERGVAKKYLSTYQDRTSRAAEKILKKVWFPQPHRHFITNDRWPFMDFLAGHIWQGKDYGIRWLGLSGIAEEYGQQGNFQMAEKIYQLTIAMTKQAQPDQHEPTVLDKTAQKRLDQLHQKMQKK
jgi:tetratricopeptide (TPR) repeat protein